MPISGKKKFNPERTFNLPSSAMISLLVSTTYSGPVPHWKKPKNGSPEKIALYANALQSKYPSLVIHNIGDLNNGLVWYLNG